GLAERPASEVVAARATAQPSPTCLLGILTTLGGDHPVAEGSKATVQTLLATLRSGSTAGPAVVYLYYAPDPGKQLTEKQAQLLLQSFAGAATEGRRGLTETAAAPDSRPMTAFGSQRLFRGGCW